MCFGGQGARGPGTERTAPFSLAVRWGLVVYEAEADPKETGEKEGTQE